MNGPASGKKNEESARAAPLDVRIPSWPNRAILCLLFTPAMTVLIAPLMLHQGDSPDGMTTSDRVLRFVGVAITAAITLVATAPLAARLSFAPLVATVLCALGILFDRVFNDRSIPLFYVTLAGLGMAWYSRSAFTRPWDPRKLSGAILRGYARLLAPDRWAGLRLVGGIVLFLGGIAFLLAVGTVLRHHIAVSKPVAQVLAIPAFLGAFLAASGLSLSERPDRNP